MSFVLAFGCAPAGKGDQTRKFGIGLAVGCQCNNVNVSKYPPAKPGALVCEPLKAVEFTA